MNWNNVKFSLSLIVLTVLAGCHGSNNHPTREHSRQTKIALGTFVQIDVCYAPVQKDNVAAAYQAAWQRIEEIEQKISTFRSDSEVSVINHSFQHPVSVSEETRALIAQSLQYSQLTRGAFDISVGPLVSLWHKAGEAGRLPTPDDVKTAQAAVGRARIQIHDNGQLELLHPQSRIDLAAIADGYAADEVARVLRAKGFAQFLIDAGGDLYAGGRNCSGEPWKIGVRDPQHKEKIIGMVEVIDQGVATSGVYEQKEQAQGQQWSHIINPLTGYPEKNIISATVIAATGAEADALATAFCVLPPQEGIALADESSSPVAAYIITTDSANHQHPYQSQRFILRNAWKKNPEKVLKQ